MLYSSQRYHTKVIGDPTYLVKDFFSDLPLAWGMEGVDMGITINLYCAAKPAFAGCEQTLTDATSPKGKNGLFGKVM